MSTISKIGFLVIFFLHAMVSFAQDISISASVMPPYSNRLTDYTQKPGKLTVVLLKVNGEIGSPTIYVEGKLSSIDGDVEIFTRPGSKPRSGGILFSGTSRTLTFNDIASIFDDQVLVYKGVTREQVLKQGLPEGAYRFCFKVYNYATNQLLSSEEIGCSNMFNVSVVEPPFIQNPLDNSEINQQFVQFLWTMPTGAPQGTSYTLKILELDRPDRNPEDAFNSTGYPVFFETEIATLMTYVYKSGAGDPPLIKGKKYAFRITAHEKDAGALMRDRPVGTYFRNGGKSEVYTFTYGEKPLEKELSNVAKIYIIIPMYNHPDSALYAIDNNINFRWTLNDPAQYNNLEKYKQTNKGPNKDTMVVKSAKYKVDIFDYKDKRTIRTVYTGAWNPFYQTFDAFMVENHSYQIKVKLFDTISNTLLGESDMRAFKFKKTKMAVTNDTSLIIGTLKYRFEGETQTYPIPNVTINLEAGYFLSMKDGKEIEVPDNQASPTYGLIHTKLKQPSNLAKSNQNTSGQNSAYNLSANIDASAMYAILGSVQTDNAGHFKIRYIRSSSIRFGVVDSTFTYHAGNKTYTGILSSALRIHINNPYYFQPEDNIMVSGLDTINAGEMITHVRGYTLKAFVTRGYAATAAVSKQLIGDSIYLFRKQKPADTPPNEGTVNKLWNGYRLIGKTAGVPDKDKDGKNTTSVTYHRLVANYVPGDEYYLIIKGSNLNTAQCISFNENGETHQDIDISIDGIDKPVLNDNLLENGLIGKGWQSIQSQVYISPLVTNANAMHNINQMNVANIQQTKNQGGQHTMSLSGWHGGTPADQAYHSMAGTSFLVQTISNGTSINSNVNSSIAAALESLKSYPIISKSGQYSFLVKTAYRIITDQYPKSKITGKLVYTWPGKPSGTKPLANMDFKVISCIVDSNSNHFIASSNTNVVATGRTDNNGNFNIEFNNINLNCGKTSGGFGNVCYGLKQMAYPADPARSCYQFVYSVYNNNYSSYDEVMASIQNYNQHHESSNTLPSNTLLFMKVFNAYRIVINQNTVFLSPDNNIILQPLDSVNVGTLTSNVLSRRYKARTTGYYTANGVTKTDVPTKNLECFLMRANEQVSNPSYPTGEGISGITGTLDEVPGYRVIDSTMVDENNEFALDNILFSIANVWPSFAPNIYLRSPEMKEGSKNAYFDPTWIFNEQDVYNNNNLPGSGTFYFEDPIINLPPYVFNNDYTYTETMLKDVIALEARLPVVKGGVRSNISNLALTDAYCYIEIKGENGNTLWIHNDRTDAKGDFHLELNMPDIYGIKQFDDWSKLWGILHVYKTGYGAEHVETIPNNTLFPGTQYVANNIILTAGGMINGEINLRKSNGTFQKVDAFVQFAELKTDNTLGMLGEMKLCAGGIISQVPALTGHHKLIVVPVDPKYFSDTVDINVTGTSYYVNVEVFERLHRVKFKIYTPGVIAGDPTALPVAGAIVELCDGQGTATSDASGNVELKFPNVSVNNLTMKIKGPYGSNYIPKYITFYNEESATVTVLPNVLLEKGFSLTGKVTLDGEPTNKANVFIDMRNMTTSGSYTSTGTIAEKAIFEAYVGTNGNFTFNALPQELRGKSIPVFAVFDPDNTLTLSQIATQNIDLNQVAGSTAQVSTITPNIQQVTNYQKNSSQQQSSSQNTNSTVSANVPVTGNVSYQPPSNQTIIGDVKTVSIPSGSLISIEPVTLNLTVLKKKRIDNIWGFPFTPISLTQTDNHGYSYQATGLVKLKNYSPGFDILNEENIIFKVTASLEIGEVVDSVKIYKPQQPVSISGVRSIKLKYNHTFNTLFENTADLQINIAGKILGQVHIVDNSFKFPSSYLSFDNSGFFYFHKNSNSVLDIFNSQKYGNGNTSEKFNLMGQNGNLKFSFIDFETEADRNKSFIEGPLITLDAIMHAQIKNAAIVDNSSAPKVDIHVPKLVLKDNGIDPVLSKDTITVTLKDEGSIVMDPAHQWRLELNEWRIDPSFGGLISNNCMVRTGKMDVKIDYFNLRNDFTYFGAITPGGVNLGGIPITLLDAEPRFGFNPCVGSDRKGHWELFILPKMSGNPVGKIEHNKLSPNLSGDLQLGTISLLSNQEDVFTINPNADPMKLYGFAPCRPVSITTTKHGFDLLVSTSLKIPRIPQELGATLSFYSNQLPWKWVTFTYLLQQEAM